MERHRLSDILVLQMKHIIEFFHLLRDITAYAWKLALLQIQELFPHGNSFCPFFIVALLVYNNNHLKSTKAPKISLPI